MDKEVLEKYMKAGSICAEVKESIKQMMRPGVKILDIVVHGEELIRKKGGEIVFPINISINEIAAHYTPRLNDPREINAGEIVKVDVGVHVDGYIVDSAFTYCSEKNKMVECADRVVEEVAKTIRPGTRVMDIGGFIEEFVEKHGFGLIMNLTGHGVDKYMYHAPPTIPNVRNSMAHELKEGDAIAIEPFVVPSRGSIKDTSITEIYSFLQDRPVRLPEARKILEMAKSEFNGLPFAKRWLMEKLSPVKVSLALRELERVNAIQTHPALREAGNQFSAQTEHTIIVGEKSIIISKSNND